MRVYENKEELKSEIKKTYEKYFKWNQLGELYQWFTDTYATYL